MSSIFETRLPLTNIKHIIELSSTFLNVFLPISVMSAERIKRQPEGSTHFLIHEPKRSSSLAEEGLSECIRPDSPAYVGTHVLS